MKIAVTIPPGHELAVEVVFFRRVVSQVMIAVTISPCHELAEVGEGCFSRRLVFWEVSLAAAGPFPVCRGWGGVSFRRVVSWQVSLAAAGPFPAVVGVGEDCSLDLALSRTCRGCLRRIFSGNSVVPSQPGR